MGLKVIIIMIWYLINLTSSLQPSAYHSVHRLIIFFLLLFLYFLSKTRSELILWTRRSIQTKEHWACATRTKEIRKCVVNYLLIFHILHLVQQTVSLCNRLSFDLRQPWGLPLLQLFFFSFFPGGGWPVTRRNWLQDGSKWLEVTSGGQLLVL